MSSPLSDETKAKLRELGVDPEQVRREKIRCTVNDGANRPACGKHIATLEQEAVGRILRLGAGQHGSVTPNTDREPLFPGQCWFDIRCHKHGIVETLAADVETVYS